MLPDRVSNPGPLTYESGAYRLRYAARQKFKRALFFKEIDNSSNEK